MPVKKWTAKDGTVMTSQELEPVLCKAVADAGGSLRDALLTLSAFYKAVDRPEEAERAAARAIDLIEDPEERAGRLLSLGASCEKRRDFEMAAHYYARGLPLEPADPLVCYLLHNNLAYSLLQTGGYEKAAVYCDSAIRIDPARHNAHKNLGLALQGLGRHEEAARAYLAAIERCPKDRRALAHLAEMVEEHPEVTETVPEVLDVLERGGGD